jgi:hypothetical protein
MNASILRLLGALAITLVAWSGLADANAPAGHYVVTAGSGTGNDTVYDTKSKLIWQRTPPSTNYTWAGAKTYCAGVGASLGGTGWRLPTIKELASIVDLSQTTGPTIDQSAFPSTSPDAQFWSSSPLAGSSTYVWYVYFFDGSLKNTAVSDPGYVRCVR